MKIDWRFDGEELEAMLECYNNTIKKNLIYIMFGVHKLGMILEAGLVQIRSSFEEIVKNNRNSTKWEKIMVDVFIKWLA